MSAKIYIPSTLFTLFLVAGFSTTACRAQTIPLGTTLPVRLEQTLNSDKGQPGKIVTVKLTQAVPLDHARRIRKGAVVIGHIVAAGPREEAKTRAQLILRFDTLRFSHQDVPVVVTLRAMAGYVQVEESALPTSNEESIPWTTVQIGGDIVYRGGGEVTTSSGEIVGKPVPDGVLASLLAPRTEISSANLHCGPDSSPHALGPFGSRACGLYGLPHLRIARDGFAEPRGEITIISSVQPLKIASGAELLLQVVAP